MPYLNEYWPWRNWSAILLLNLLDSEEPRVVTWNIWFRNSSKLVQIENFMQIGWMLEMLVSMEWYGNWCNPSYGRSPNTIMFSVFKNWVNAQFSFTPCARCWKWVDKIQMSKHECSILCILRSNKELQQGANTDSFVEVGFVITPKIVYVPFLSLQNLNKLLSVVVHQLRPTSTGIVKVKANI